MKDVYDYLRRMFMAIFLCPVAVMFWLAFAFYGFSPGGFMQFLGALGRDYAVMDSDGQIAFLFQILFGWAVLAFAFLLLSFVTSPPRFAYILKKKDGKPMVSVVE